MYHEKPKSLISWVCIRCRAMAMNIPDGWLRLTYSRDRHCKECVCSRCQKED